MYIIYREINRSDTDINDSVGFIRLEAQSETYTLKFPSCDIVGFSIKMLDCSTDGIAFDLLQTQNGTAIELDTVILEPGKSVSTPFESYKFVAGSMYESYEGELEFHAVTNAEAHDMLLSSVSSLPRDILLGIAEELLSGDECERDIPLGIELAARADMPKTAELFYALLADNSINGAERAEYIRLIADNIAESFSGEVRVLYAELLLGGEGIEKDPVLATELLMSKFIRNYPYPRRHRALKRALEMRGCDKNVIRHLDILDMPENNNVYTVSELCSNICDLALSNADLRPLTELTEYRSDIDLKVAIGECFAQIDKPRAYSIFSSISGSHKYIFSCDADLDSAIAKARLWIVTLAFDNILLAANIDEIIFNAAAYIAYLCDLREYDGDNGLFRSDPYDGDIDLNILLAKNIIIAAAKEKNALAERVLPYALY